MKNNILIIGLLSISLFTMTFADAVIVKQLINDAKQYAGEIEAHELKRLIEEENIIVLDIRELEQRVDGEIYADEMLHTTRGNLEFYIPGKIKDHNITIVTYCRAGERSALAAQTLKRMGYKNAISLKNGLRGWAEAGYGIETAIGVMRLSK